MNDYVSTPSYDEFLAHYGVKGMKWGKRKTGNQVYNQEMARRTGSSAYAELSKLSDDEYQNLLSRFKLTGGKSSKSSSSKSAKSSKSSGKGSKSAETKSKSSKTESGSSAKNSNTSSETKEKIVEKTSTDSEYLKWKEAQLNKHNQSGINVSDILERIRTKNRKQRAYNTGETLNKLRRR